MQSALCSLSFHVISSVPILVSFLPFSNGSSCLFGLALWSLTRISFARLVRLKKGCAYHLDLFVVGILNGFLSMYGLPWMHGVLPHSPLHLRSLADIEERVDQGHVYEMYDDFDLFMRLMHHVSGAH